MFQYRQALVRMRQGDSDRQIAAARIMGRRTAARLREFCTTIQSAATICWCAVSHRCIKGTL